MNLNKYTYTLLLMSFVFTVTAEADSPVWKVSKGHYHLYLGGTIHLLGKNDYPLPSAFEKAYKNSSVLFFEADIQKMETPEAQKILMEKLTFQGDETIKHVLNSETYDALEKYFSERGLPIEQMMKFKPGMIVMMLTVIEMQRLNIAGMGVDSFFVQKGNKDGKRIRYLEKVEEQLMFIAEMGKDKPNELIAYTLRDMEKLSEQMAAMKLAWKTGDNIKLQQIALTPWKKDFPELYNTLLVTRNNKWIPEIESMLNTKEIEFVLFGALHMVGEDGVLSQLQARGYKIQKM